jgi:hypothetical protein
MNWNGWLASLKNWLRLDRAGRQAVLEIRERFEAALREEADLAQRHRADSYYTDLSTGHNVGADELIAAGYARRIDVRPSAHEEERPAAYLLRLLEDLENSKSAFEAAETDVDGYGIGTLHSLTQKLLDGFGEKYIPLTVRKIERARANGESVAWVFRQRE